MAERIPSREMDIRVGIALGWRWLRFPAIGEVARIGLVSPDYLSRMLPEYVAANTVAEYDGRAPISLPEYSADISCAFQVVEALRAKGWSWQLTLLRGGRVGVALEHREVANTITESFASSLPEAICLAALKAIESEPSSLPTENR